MKFDLTFSGQVFEKFDADTVRQALGDLLEIDDEDTLQALFLGRHFVLAKHLSRKAAAEAFSKLTTLGARVELVPSGTGPEDAKVLRTALWGHNDAATEVLAAGSGDFKESHSYADGENRIWPVSAAKRPKIAANEETLAESGPVDAEPTEAEPVESEPEHLAVETISAAKRSRDSVLAAARRGMKALQREMDSTKLRARNESEKLQHRIDHFQRIADRELERLASEEAAISDKCVTDVEALDEQAMSLRADVDAQLADLKNKERDTLQQTKEETDRLNGLLIESEDEEQSAVEQLEAARKDIRDHAERRVQELRAQIEELEAGAAQEITELEEHAQDHIRGWQQERENLALEQGEIQKLADERLEWLSQEQTRIEQAAESSLASIATQRDRVRDAREQAVLALQEAALEVSANLEKNLDRARRADEAAREKSKATLQELHARKLELQRRATVAMHDASETVLANQNSALSS